MGQASSIQRDQRQEHAPRSILPSRLLSNGHSDSLNIQDMSGQPMDTYPSHEEGGDAHRNSILNHETGPSSPYSAGTTPSGSTAITDAISYEPNLRSLPEPIQDNPRGTSVSRIMSRRQSTMSRLGSRILPNSVIRGLLSSEEETPAEGHAHRNGRLTRNASRAESAHSSRFSPFNSLASRGIARRRSIRGPYPLPRGDAALIPDSPPNPSYVNSPLDIQSGAQRGWRRSPRLNRVRNSLTTPISHIFGQPPTLPVSEEPMVPPQRPSRTSFSDDLDSLLPPLAPMDTNMSFNEAAEMDSVEPSLETLPPISPRNHTRTGQGPGPVRRLPGILRTRSSRLPRREEQTSLSRVLQLAAAAIAAQLSGSTLPTLPNIQSLGNDGLDASLETLIQSLQQATSTQSNTSGSSGSQTQSPDASAAPVNFLRVFRFANTDSQGGRPAAESGENNASRAPDQMDIDDPSDETAEGRTVTLVVVGVRSVPTNGPLSNQQNNGGMGLDALLGLPLIPSNTTPRDRASTNSLFRNADGSARLPPPRPLNGTANSLLEGLDSQPRHSSSSLTQRRPLDSSIPDGPSSSLPVTLSDSPPGPNPPPSTPAEPTLSAVSSGNSTPSRRPSSASAIFPNSLPQVHEESPLQPMRDLESSTTAAATTTGARQRRRSDSEYARHRHLGLGAARRNGVVEPDQPTPSTGRTWVIYVVGTNLSENHPAFATPSLFTDNPTYEDMILLSSLLGPAKPPVATQADVTSAGGLFSLVEYAGTLVAEALEGGECIGIGESERCLICLSEYEAADEVRQLTKCKHIYHKECIDQWLTTGRNSCPLCRGQGVAESSNNSYNNPAQEASA